MAVPFPCRSALAPAIRGSPTLFSQFGQDELKRHSFPPLFLFLLPLSAVRRLTPHPPERDVFPKNKLELSSVPFFPGEAMTTSLPFPLLSSRCRDNGGPYFHDWVVRYSRTGHRLFPSGRPHLSFPFPLSPRLDSDPLLFHDGNPRSATVADRTSPPPPPLPYTEKGVRVTFSSLPRTWLVSFSFFFPEGRRPTRPPLPPDQSDPEPKNTSNEPVP